MKTKIVLWIEKFFYQPSNAQIWLSKILLPLSWLYCFIMKLRYLMISSYDFDMNIISIGNLTVGGSGKTPLTIAIAKQYSQVAVILRGYGRDSHGLHVVSDGNDILTNVKISGDEAMIYAQKLKHAVVIVSEDRIKGILKAREMGAKIIFLDDGYSKHNIKKLDFLIVSNVKNSACLPAGPYRERAWRDKNIEYIYEDKDFQRSVKIINPTKKMVLATAIARASRLDAFLPEIVNKYYFEDHYSFTKEELVDIMDKNRATSLLVTYKDYVKIQDFNLNVSILDLHIDVNERIFNIIDRYIKGL